MSKPRDYKAEHARRSIGKRNQNFRAASKLLGVTNLEALKKFNPEDELHAAINSEKWPDAGIFQLLKMARIDPEGARDLLKRPEEIGALYKLFRRKIAAERPKRVCAADRINRAWQPYWDRWLQKLIPKITRSSGGSKTGNNSTISACRFAFAAPLAKCLGLDNSSKSFSRATLRSDK
jgi:hypothetical protein